MNWLFEEIYRAIVALRRWQTWLAIGLISTFILLAYMVSQYAFRTDAVLIFLRRTTGSCRELSNGLIIFLFCGMFFFLFSAVLTLGEFQRYLEFRQRGAHRQARQSLYWGVSWGLMAVGVSVAALFFFNQYCR